MIYEQDNKILYKFALLNINYAVEIMQPIAHKHNCTSLKKNRARKYLLKCSWIFM